MKDSERLEGAEISNDAILLKDAIEIETDPKKAEARKTARVKRFHQVELPLVRSVGFALLLIGAYLHNRLFLEAVDPQALLSLGLFLFGYVTISWLVLYAFYDRVRWINLGDVMLACDLLPMIVTIYYTGVERSLFFWLLIVRTADQISRGFWRAATFAHLNVAAYLLFLLYLEHVALRPVAWGLEVTRLAMLYGFGLYLLFVAYMTEDVQTRMTAAIKLSRGLIVQLQQEKLKAQAANLAKSQFLTNMSHELRTPLNSIIGFARVLLSNKKLGLDKKALTYTERIFANGKHLLDLINEILDLSKIETGHTEIYPEDVDLDALIHETVEQLEGHRSPKLQLTLDLPRFIAPLRTDRQKLKQVLINLIGNALKFTSEGTVTVAVLTDPPTRQPLRIEIRDTGPGLSPRELETIFEPFHQLDNTTTRRHGGTGLGLTITKTMLELLDFSLSVESSRGRGSCFAILLTPPVDVPPTGVHKASRSADDSKPAKLTEGA